MTIPDEEEIPEDTEAEEVEVDAEDDQTEGDDGEGAADPKVEAEARAMNWKPKDQWRGNPDDWRPADEFVRRGKEILPIVQKRNRDLEARITKQQEDFDKKIANLERMSKVALDRQKSDILAKYEGLKEQAVERGDTKAYKQAAEGERDALKAFDDAAKAKEDEPAKPADRHTDEDKRVGAAWWQENQDIAADPVLHAASNGVFDEIEREMPDATMREKLEETRQRLAQYFPDRLKGATKQRRPPMVEGSSGRGPNGSGGSLWGKLDREAKTQADSFIKEHGLYLGKDESADNPKHMAAARERYAKQYFEEA